MHMHDRFMHGKHMGPPHHGMFHGRHGMEHSMMARPHGMGHHMMHKPHFMGPHMPHKSGCKPHGMGHHRMQRPFFHRMIYGMHGKHFYTKNHNGTSSSSSSSSSESGDELRAHCNAEAQSGWKHHGMHRRHGNPHHQQRHFMMDHLPEPGEVVPYMKPAYHGPFCRTHKKHKQGPHS